MLHQAVLTNLFSWLLVQVIDCLSVSIFFGWGVGATGLYITY